MTVDDKRQAEVWDKEVARLKEEAEKQGSPLTDEQIAFYIEQEKPLDCAGSFKCEGLGIALFSSLDGKDFNTLIGLPLIELTRLLAKNGIDVLKYAATNPKDAQ